MHKCDGCKYKSEHQEMKFQAVGICTKEYCLLDAVNAYNATECPFEVGKQICHSQVPVKQIKDRSEEDCGKNQSSRGSSGGG